MSDDKTFEQLREYIRENIFWRDLPLTRNTDLENDLGIHGDDIEEFFYKFSNKFNIDISEFDAKKYFEMGWFYKLKCYLKKEKVVRKTLTLEDLEEAIRNKKLK